MNVNTYLHYNGNCEEALKFYEKALGAKITMLMRYGDAPANCQTAPEVQQKIMHGRIAIGDSVIMVSDAPPGYFHGQNGFSLSLSINTPEEAERLFTTLSEKGTISMPLAETFWATRFGMLIDQFGVPWMINCEKQG